MNIQIDIETWPLAAPFRITGHLMKEVAVVVVTLRDGDLEARGEAAGVYYRHETAAVMARQIAAVSHRIAAGLDRESLRTLLPPGGARNAVDCALWELEAQRARCDVWKLAQLERSPRPLLTTYTLGASTPEAMSDAARRFVGARALKLKLTGDAEDADRVRAVRAARPDVWIGVDANQGFTRTFFDQLLPVLTEARVSLIEQPFPIEQDALMDGLGCPIPIAADESCHTLADVPALVSRFDVVNVKLDKCGGLTEALEMVRLARRLGLKVMVGNMLGTSLAMAPAFVVGQLCEVVDLDGPLLLARDRPQSVSYEDGCISCPASVWGALPMAERTFAHRLSGGHAHE